MQRAAEAAALHRASHEWLPYPTRPRWTIALDALSRVRGIGALAQCARIEYEASPQAAADPTAPSRTPGAAAIPNRLSYGSCSELP
ncbi:hypothetical protein BH18ACT16_BH18ACT16_14280 [soil metagenome]